MKVLAEIEFDANPETKEHAQHVLDQWTRFNPLQIEICSIIEED